MMANPLLVTDFKMFGTQYVTWLMYSSLSTSTSLVTSTSTNWVCSWDTRLSIRLLLMDPVGFWSFDGLPVNARRGESSFKSDARNASGWLMDWSSTASSASSTALFFDSSPGSFSQAERATGLYLEGARDRDFASAKVLLLPTLAFTTSLLLLLGTKPTLALTLANTLPHQRLTRVFADDIAPFRIFLRKEWSCVTYSPMLMMVANTNTRTSIASLAL
mmetsp:Transcript_7863/g.12220  ORF Transcript_7863/g.12220 Transcript_7863/m.12220 type:complete len:218 (+) Transcript_7863:1024-1677(+)